MTTPPPSTQEMTAAGPASDEAYNAPNNQPAPMIDPKDAKRRPRPPMSRRSFRAARSELATSGCASSAVTPDPFQSDRPRPTPAWPDHGSSPRLPQPHQDRPRENCGLSHFVAALIAALLVVSQHETASGGAKASAVRVMTRLQDRRVPPVSAADA